ncbi:DUF4350 domain-containing protein [Georgenia muralis]|uniref:Uncharacterized protein DUF4350 n=1 Tax=Georgenia muralis TaxID=154117 RepID=A0A3N5A1W2_9MICO|nr:DUF4350 domain-containing protein [Georgenia muralis]RPF25861.1 uncharacterized protein DUF4350 [Georgenia muralis]
MSAATAAPAVERGPTWWSRNRFPVLASLAFAVLMLAAVALTVRSSDRPLAPDNPRPDGAQAAAEILRRQGVEVRPASSLADVGALAGPGSTVLVVDPGLLSVDQRAEIVATGADLVIAGDPFTDLEGFGVPLLTSGAGSADPVDAACADPDAVAAGRVGFTRGSVGPADGGTGGEAVVCFPVGDGDGGYAVWSDGARTVRYLADERLMSNEFLAVEGNAALTLRALGRHEVLVWFLPGAVDTTSTGASVPLVPPAATAALTVLAAAALVLALAHGRALGPVVTEVMPVVVRSAETTRGRGRLYRRSGAHDHAAASLRAGTADRLARTLGLPRSAGPDALLGALARATGRPDPGLRQLLYGPPPTSDAALLALSAELDALESEVHQ